MALYNEASTMIVMDGSVARGVGPIREAWASVLAMNGTMTLRSRYVIEVGDLAVLSVQWTLRIGQEMVSAVTAEVAARQPDGGWVYLIDHPFAGSEPDEIAAVAAAAAGSTS
jgi:ketosteroid isomerase-like protein